MCTRPTTLTTTGWSGSAAGLAEERGLAVATFSTGGSLADITGAGRSRTNVNTVTSTASAATIASPMAPARPGSARTFATQPRSSDASGSQRGSSEFWSSFAESSADVVPESPAAASASGSARSRRCRRSAGSSVRMGRP